MMMKSINTVSKKIEEVSAMVKNLCIKFKLYE